MLRECLELKAKFAILHVEVGGNPVASVTIGRATEAIGTVEEHRRWSICVFTAERNYEESAFD
jgi:hypothetical protein